MRKLSKIEFSGLFFLSLAVIAFLANCGGVNSVYYDGRSCAEGITSGAEIYVVAGCSSTNGCHGPNKNSPLVPLGDRSLATFNMAISREPRMNFLTCLTNEQKAAVVSYLNQ